MFAMIRIHLMLLVMLMASVALAQDRCASAHKDVISACNPANLVIQATCDTTITFCLNTCKDPKSTQYLDCFKRKENTIKTQAPGVGTTLTLEGESKSKEGIRAGIVLSPNPRVANTLIDDSYEEYLKRNNIGAGFQVTVPLRTGSSR